MQVKLTSVSGGGRGRAGEGGTQNSDVLYRNSVDRPINHEIRGSQIKKKISIIS
jgi:hypothetical protein